MTEPPSTEPLYRYPVLRTSSVKEWERVMIETFGAKGCRIPNPENVWARANFLGLNDLTLGYSASGPRCILDYDEADCVRMRLVLQGNVETKTGSAFASGSAGHPSIASPGQSVTSDYGENLELCFSGSVPVHCIKS